MEITFDVWLTVALVVLSAWHVWVLRKLWHYRLGYGLLSRAVRLAAARGLIEPSVARRLLGEEEDECHALLDEESDT